MKKEILRKVWRDGEKTRERLEKLVDSLIAQHRVVDDPDKKNVELNAYKKQMTKYYASLPTREKAEAAYDRLRVSVAKTDPELLPFIFAEIEILLKEKSVRDLFFKTLAESRVQSYDASSSPFGKKLQILEHEINIAESQFKELERKLFTSADKNSARNKIASGRLKSLAQTLEEKNNEMLQELLVSGETQDEAHTDVIAQRQYEQLQEYRKQLQQGFVWLPSRKRIHEQTIQSLQNYRWPLLIGEAGSGKSEQADAAAKELTGYDPVSVACDSRTGEADLVGVDLLDPKTGGSYKEYGALVSAYTGFETSLEEKPTYPNGRMVRFDEFGLLGDRAYALLKEARQLKAGDMYQGHEVLPGASAILTSNPVGPRYPNRRAPDAALRREIAEIYVDYPEMSNEDPELYEYLVTSLMDSKGYVNVAKEEVSPYFERKELDADDPEANVFSEFPADDKRIVARTELLVNDADRQHGILWRFSHAIKALQNSFIAGNATLDKSFTDRCLRYREVEDVIEVSPDGVGESLTLSSSTITLGELASWMKTYNERRERNTDARSIETLEKWLQMKINGYIKQADKADKEKIQAIFVHFGCLDKVSLASTSTPMTHRDIGYLSPRVPRPLEFAKIHPAEEEKAPVKEKRDLSMYTAKNVLMENGESLYIREVDAENILEEGDHKFSVMRGNRLEIDGKEYVYDGIVEDADSKEYIDKGAVHFANGEKLYRVYDAEELVRGKLLFESRGMVEECDALVEKSKEFWSVTCGNEEYVKYYKETTEPEPVWS